MNKEFSLGSVMTQGDGGGWGGRLKKERIYVYLYQIHFIVQQKLSQHYEVIMLLFNHEVVSDSS